MFRVIHSFPLQQGAFRAYRGPLVVDLDGDRQQEICAEDDLGNVWLLDHQARLLPGWPFRPVLQPMRGYSALAAANVFPDGPLEFILLQNNDNAGTGWVSTFNRQGLRQLVILNPNPGDLYAVPALVSLDGNPPPELIVPAEIGTLFGFKGDSIQPLPGWGWPANPWVGALGDVAFEVATGDINGDLHNDVVVAGTDGDLVALGCGAGLPLRVFRTAEHVATSPALGDLDGDGRLDVVAVCCGSPGVVYIWNRNGILLRRWPVKGVYFDSPSLGNLDADDDLEICAVSLDGLLFAWNMNGTSVDGNGDGQADFPVRVFNAPGNDFQATPLIADLDGLPGAEILVSSKRVNKMYAYHQDGRAVADFPLQLPAPVELPNRTAPVISDINADGRVEIVIAWGSRLLVFSTFGRAADVQWGSFAHDYQNSRNYEFSPERPR